jgi:hypothetical protein
MLARFTVFLKKRNNRKARNCGGFHHEPALRKKFGSQLGKIKVWSIAR